MPIDCSVEPLDRAGSDSGSTRSRPHCDAYAARVAAEVAPALRDLAGLATYRGQVKLLVFLHAEGGYPLDLGRIEGVYTVSINGQQIEGADQLKPVLDVSFQPRAGVNEVAVDVATTLCGSVKCDPARDEGLLGRNGQVLLRRYSLQPVRESRQVSLPRLQALGSSPLSTWLNGLTAIVGSSSHGGARQLS